MKKYTFTLILDTTELSDKLRDALFEAGCDDALLWSEGGKVGADFTRKAASKRVAVESATADIRRAGLNAQLETVSAS
jgi:hypothetical protein